MAKNKDIDSAEELSRLLDELNAGKEPASNDPETAELLKIAALLRQSDIPASPPPHLLEQTAARAMAGLQAREPKKKRRNNWLYSSALGTAAAVLLAVGLHLLPTSPLKQPPLTPQPIGDDYQPPLVETPLVAARAEQTPAATSSKPSPEARQQITAPPSADPRGTASVAPDAPITAPPVQLPVVASPSPNAQQPPTAPPGSPGQPPQQPNSKQSADIAGPESLRLAETRTLFKAAVIPKNAPQPVIPLRWADQKPDIIDNDQVTGTIRQAFHTGTANEIIITQHPLAKIASVEETPSLTASDAGSRKTGTLNRVTIIRYGQEITIEGQQPREELLKIAESLVP